MRSQVKAEKLNAQKPGVEHPEAEDLATEASPAGKGTLLERVREFIEKLVFLPKVELYTLVATWVIATHMHQEFDYMGYLFAYSPEHQSGKSTLLKVLHLLVYESTGPQVSPTPAVLFRTAEKHTQLLDEVDSWTNPAELKDVLNSGFEKGGSVTRCDRDPRVGFKPKTFYVYGPRALAGIGVGRLHQTTLDRTFAFQMLRQNKAEKRERLRPCNHAEPAKQLKTEIETWVSRTRPMLSLLTGRGVSLALTSLVIGRWTLLSHSFPS